MLWLWIILGLIALVVAYDLTQRHHTILRNFPIIGLRLANYVAVLRKELLELAHAVGVAHPGLVRPDQLEVLDEGYRSTPVFPDMRSSRMRCPFNARAAT